MKSIFTILALTAISATASAGDLFDASPVASIEYNYNNIAAHGGHNQYGYVGIAQPTKFGTFDIGMQGILISTPSANSDKANGFEVGYSYPMSVDVYRITPRVAYGAMNHLDASGSGFASNARYYQVSVEATAPITQDVGSYISYSHQGAVNTDFGTSVNRIQYGVDFSLTKRVGLRTGLSFARSGGVQQNGLVAVMSYGF